MLSADGEANSVGKRSSGGSKLKPEIGLKRRPSASGCETSSRARQSGKLPEAPVRKASLGQVAAPADAGAIQSTRMMIAIQTPPHSLDFSLNSISSPSLRIAQI